LSVQTCDSIPIKFKIWKTAYESYETPVLTQVHYPATEHNKYQLISLKEDSEKELLPVIFTGQILHYQTSGITFSTSNVEIVARVDPNFVGEI